jgi:hypothetical protein
MNITSIGTNQIVMLTKDGDHVLYSYDIPVAGFHHVVGWFKTSEKCSRTTTKRINSFLNSEDSVTTLTQEEIENLFKGE